MDRIAQARDAYAGRGWAAAFEAFGEADEAGEPLSGDDLERWAMCAYLVGRDETFLTAFERAHHAHVQADAVPRAARCAFWLGFRLLLRGESAQASGWFSRAQRLLEGDAPDCVERGYLLLPVAEQRLQTGDLDAAFSSASGATQAGERFGDADLVAAARHVEGRVWIARGEVERGLALLDEVMVAVTGGELSPVITGLVYCSVIDCCRDVYALGRSCEWTTALARWCDAQPEMVAFTGTCRVHRAEILQLRGDWDGALEEARRACARFSSGLEARPPASAYYEEAEVHRLRGAFAAAEEAYRNANDWGREPQPGLSLLRMAQGRTKAAGAAMRRVLGATRGPLRRARLLAAHVDVMLALGEADEAREACEELDATARRFPTDVLRALGAQARGAVDLAAGEARTALENLRSAWGVWRDIEAPYAAARVRVLIGRCCMALGDQEGGNLEWDAARAVFERLGAAPDVAALASSDPSPPAAHGLTPREREVLRLVAEGATNRAIAARLFISEKTVARHVSNIFLKLGLSTRSAAAAYAHKHELA